MIELSSAEMMKDKGASVALGIFDGVHRGHRAVIGRAAEIGREKGLAPAVCTFKTASVDTKGGGYLPIYSDSAKFSLLEKAGIGYVYSPEFCSIKDMSPEDFVKDKLIGIMNARELVCGRDFRFGKGAACSIEGLGEICGRLGIGLTVAEDVTENGVRISSADIRKYITGGEIEKANLLLGHDYTVTGKVIHGNRFGRTMDFPTANQALEKGFALPRFGVYASYAEIDGKVFRGVTNIGVKPTVDSSGKPLSETHFPEFSGDLYGKNIEVHLISFIRPEMKFSGADELKAQIKNDVNTVMSMT